VVTDTARPPATNTQTHRQDRLQYTAPLASAQCNTLPGLWKLGEGLKDFQERAATLCMTNTASRCTLGCSSLISTAYVCSVYARTLSNEPSARCAHWTGKHHISALCKYDEASSADATLLRIELARTLQDEDEFAYSSTTRSLTDNGQASRLGTADVFNSLRLKCVFCSLWTAIRRELASPRHRCKKRSRKKTWQKLKKRL